MKCFGHWGEELNLTMQDTFSMMLEAGDGIMEFSPKISSFYLLGLLCQMLALAEHAKTGAMRGLGWLLHKNDM